MNSFSKYMQLLQPFIGGGLSQSEYISRIIGNVVLESHSDDPKNILDVKPKTMAKWLQGGEKNSLPKKRAEEILTFLDSGKFETFVYDTLTDDSSTVLSEKLDSLNFKFKSVEVSEKCEEYLVAVLNHIVNDGCTVQKGKSSNSATIPCNQDYGNQLFLEENGKCPNDGCTNLLYKTINDKTVNTYELATIDTNLPVGIENTIALCHDCKLTFEATRTKASVARMKEIKREAFRARETIELIENNKLEDGLERVVKKISELPASTLTQLNYSPVSVDKKIPSDIFLLQKVQSMVSTWYPYVRDIFKEVSNETKKLKK